jgi:hypothetical protein
VAGTDWRNAGLPPILLRDLLSLARSPLFTPRECAALGLARAALLGQGDGHEAPAAPLHQARRHLTEGEIAEIAGSLADHHSLDDPLT